MADDAVAAIAQRYSVRQIVRQLRERRFRLGVMNLNGATHSATHQARITISQPAGFRPFAEPVVVEINCSYRVAPLWFLAI